MWELLRLLDHSPQVSDAHMYCAAASTCCAHGVAEQAVAPAGAAAPARPCFHRMRGAAGAALASTAKAHPLFCRTAPQRLPAGSRVTLFNCHDFDAAEFGGPESKVVAACSASAAAALPLPPPLLEAGLLDAAQARGRCCRC